MTALLLIMLSVVWSGCSTNVHSVDHVMREVLRQAMRCPEWPNDRDLDAPVAAFSPARYIQLVALVRNQSREDSCGRRNQLPFNLDRPRTWNFCAMGVCTVDDSCSCFYHFVGDKCAQFQGDCWLFYCRLVGCGRNMPSLYCSCNPEQDGIPVLSGLHFYDEGLKHTYIPPPLGVFPSVYLDSHLIERIGFQSYDIIRGNSYENRAIRIRKKSAKSAFTPRSTKGRYNHQDEDISHNFYSSYPRSHNKDSYYVYKPQWKKTHILNNYRHFDRYYDASRRNFGRNYANEERFPRQGSSFPRRRKNSDSVYKPRRSEMDAIEESDDEEGAEELSDDRLRREDLAEEDGDDDSVENYAISLGSGQTRPHKLYFPTIFTYLSVFILCHFL